MAEIKISLAAARVNARLTQKDIAKALKVSPVTIVAWEKGERSPSYATLMCLSDIYDIPLENIFLPSPLTKSKKEQT